MEALTRHEVSNWVQTVTLQLKEKLGGDHASLILLTSFVTQYELKMYREVKEVTGLTYLLSEVKRALSGMFIKTDLSNPISGDIVFWPHQPIHQTYFGPIIRSMTGKGLNPCLTGINSSLWNEDVELHQNVFKKKGSGLIHLYWFNKAARKILKEAKNVPPVNLEGRIVSFDRLLVQCWKDYYYMYKETLRHGQRVLKTINPKLLFVGNVNTLVGSVSAQLAKSEGVKVATIMHGTLSPYSKFTWFDYFFVFGKTDEDKLVNDGVDKSRIRVSGSPHIQKLIKSSKQSGEKEFFLVGLSGPGHSVSLENHKQIIENLTLAIKTYNQTQWKIKLHRKDRRELYSALLPFPNVEILEYNAEVSIYDLLPKAKALVTGASTTALEAMSISCPVITMDFRDELNEVSFIEDDMTNHSLDKDSFFEKLNLIMVDSPQIQEKTGKSKLYSFNYFEDTDESVEDYICRLSKDIIKGL